MADAKKLSSMDASFLYLETPEMPMHVGSMAIFRLPENFQGNFFEDFKAMIASRLLHARMELRTALANDDGACADHLTTECLHAEHLGLGIAPISR